MRHQPRNIMQSVSWTFSVVYSWEHHHFSIWPLPIWIEHTSLIAVGGELLQFVEIMSTISILFLSLCPLQNSCHFSPLQFYCHVYWTFVPEYGTVNVLLQKCSPSLLNFLLFTWPHSFPNNSTGNLGIILNSSFYYILSPTSPCISKSSSSLKYLPFQSALSLDKQNSPLTGLPASTLSS